MLKDTNETITSRSDDFENVIASFQQRLEAVDVLQNRLGGLNFIKQRVQHRFSSEICKTFKNTSGGCFWRVMITKFGKQGWQVALTLGHADMKSNEGTINIASCYFVKAL